LNFSLASNHAQVLGALSHSLLGIGTNVNQLIGHFGRLKTAISGALGVAVGSELFSLITSITEKTSHELTQLKKLGLTPAEVARVHAEAVRITRTVPGVTELQALKIPGPSAVSNTSANSSCVYGFPTRGARFTFTE
jgi:hypothetical protein